MSKKGKTCSRCGKELSGIRSRFCSDTCYLAVKRSQAKEYSQKFRFQIPERDCEICGKEFKPIRGDVTACSKSCSRIKTRQKQRERRKKSRKLEIVKPMKASVKPIKIQYKVSYHTEPKFVNSEDPKHTKLKNAVQDFVAKGGTIEQQPIAPGSKIPTVNLKFGFLAEDVFGFGWEKNSDELLEDYNDRN